MGQISFVVQDDRLTSPRVLSSIHMMAFDGTIWPCRCQLENGTSAAKEAAAKEAAAKEAAAKEAADHRLIVERNSNQSARLFLLYPTISFGEICVGTATLLERELPYNLSIELARGTLCRLRNLISNWREGGLAIPESIVQRTGQAQSQLAQAIFESSAPQLAGAAIEAALELMFSICHEFDQQVAQFRHDTTSPREILFGVTDLDMASPHKLTQFLNCQMTYAGLSVDTDDEDDQTYDSQHWVDELSESSEDTVEDNSGESIKRITAIYGPLMDSNPGGLPEWICQMQHIEQRRQAILDVARQALGSMQPDSCDLLYAVSGINGVGHRYMTFSQQLHLTIDVIQVVENLLPTTPIMVSFDQPWGERLAWSVGGGHALQIADTLLRQGCRIDVLGLEINLDYWPIGSLPRDPSQWVDLLDFWSHFNLPLMVFLRMPCIDDSSLAKGAKPPSTASAREALPKSQQILHNLDAEQQVQYLQAILPLLLGRPNIRGVIWNQRAGGGMFEGCSIVDPNQTTVADCMSEILTRWEI